MGASKGELKPKVVINDIDIEQIPMEQIKNSELYLIELMTKKRQMTDKYVGEGIKPTKEDNIMMTRLNIEISEQMQKIFHGKKKRKGKKPKNKIILDPLLPVYKYSKLKNDFEILSWQWEELNGEHEEFNKVSNEKKKVQRMIKDRGLHRQDPFYPDDNSEDNEETGQKENENNNANGNNFSNFFSQNRNDDEEDEEEGEDEES